MGGLEMEQQSMPHGSSGWAAILCPGPDGGNYLMSHAHIAPPGTGQTESAIRVGDVEVNTGHPRENHMGLRERSPDGASE